MHCVRLCHVPKMLIYMHMRMNALCEALRPTLRQLDRTVACLFQLLGLEPTSSQLRRCVPAARTAHRSTGVLNTCAWEMHAWCEPPLCTPQPRACLLTCLLGPVT